MAGRGKLIMVLALTLGAALVSLALGSARVPLASVAELLVLKPLGLTHAAPPAWQEEVVLRVRLPRLALGLMVGAGLGLAGVVFQGLLRNPLADPFILGTSSGAALGATLMLALGAAHSAHLNALVPVAAFAGSLVALAAVYLFARAGGRVPVETLLLAGVMVNAFLFALVLLVLALARLEAAEALLWLMGSLALTGSLGAAAWVGLAIVPAAIVALVYARDLNALSLGEDHAAALGVEPARVKLVLFVSGSILVGAAVSAAGIIGFVGLIVPHIARLVFGPDHRRLVPAAMVLGAGLLIAADTVARTALAPTELPVGVVTALAGAPFFLVLLRRARRAW